MASQPSQNDSHDKVRISRQNGQLYSNGEAQCLRVEGVRGSRQADHALPTLDGSQGDFLWGCWNNLEGSTILAFAKMLTGQHGIWPWDRVLKQPELPHGCVSPLRKVRKCRIGPSFLARVLRYCRGVSGTIEKCLLPQAPANWSIGELGLKRRTLGALVSNGFGPDIQSLADMTVGDALRIPRFGLRGLMELLTALERFPCVARTHLEPSEPAARITGELDEVLSIPGVLALSPEDPRLGKSFREVDRSCKNFGLLLMRATGLSPVPLSMDQFGRLQELCAQIRALERCSLEEEFFGIVSPALRGRRREIAATYFGFRTRQRETLETTGTKFGVTRERVRQLCIGAMTPKTGAPPFAPALESALEFVHEALPHSASTLHEALVSRGLLGASTTLATIVKVAEFLGRDPGFVILNDGSDLAVKTTDRGAVRTIKKHAERLLSRHGATTYEALVEAITQELQISDVRSFVLEVLEADPTFRWLERETGWFWLETQHPNPLRKQIRKVLTVAHVIDAAELRGALRRGYRVYAIPPIRILREFCRQIPECHVHAGQIIADQFEEAEDVLRGDELIVVRILLRHGPICRRKELQRLARAAGVSAPSFWRCVNYCPTISRFARGVYGLTGAHVPADLVESLRTKKQPGGRLVVDHGWTDDGRVWVACRVSEAFAETGVMGVPTPKRSYIQGKYRLQARTNAPAGTLTVRDSSAWGFGPFLRRARAEPGDILLIKFAPASKTATVQLGDEALLDEVTAVD